MIVIIAASSFHYAWVKYPLFYFSSASSALFLPTLCKHCILKALTHTTSDDYLVLNTKFKAEICFQSPSGQCLSSMKTLRRQRIGNRWQLKLEQYNIHKMQRSRIHLPLSHSVSAFTSSMPTSRTTKSPFLFLSGGDCSFVLQKLMPRFLGCKWSHSNIYHSSAQQHNKLKDFFIYHGHLILTFQSLYCLFSTIFILLALESKLPKNYWVLALPTASNKPL